MTRRSRTSITLSAIGCVSGLAGVVAATLNGITGLVIASSAATSWCAVFMALTLWKEHRNGRHRKAEEDRGDPGPIAGGGTLTFTIDPAYFTGAVRTEEAGASPSLTTERQDEPIRGWRVATVELVGTSFRFSALNDGHGSYGIEASARCHRYIEPYAYMYGPTFRVVGPHSPPHEDCRCGFYAFSERDAAVSFARDHRNGVVLEADLYGRVIVHERGFRAQKQRVLSVTLPAECLFCTATPLPAVPFVGGPIAYVCDQHCPSDHVTVPVSALSSKLGTEIRRAEDRDR